MDEKALPPRPKRFNAVGFCLTAIRIWQWSSSFFAYASFSLLYEHIQRNRLGENERMKGVQILVWPFSPRHATSAPSPSLFMQCRCLSITIIAMN
jgi:hypothetical protein